MHEGLRAGKGGLRVRTRITFRSALPVKSSPTSFAWLKHVGDSQENRRVKPQLYAHPQPQHEVGVYFSHFCFENVDRGGILSLKTNLLSIYFIDIITNTHLLTQPS